MSNMPDKVGKTLVSTCPRACVMQNSASKGYMDDDAANELRIRGTLLTTYDLSRWPDVLEPPELLYAALARTSKEARIS